MGVRIYVDVVLNHMTNREQATGVGTGGSQYNAIEMTYPAVPFNTEDFHGPEDCPTVDGEIADYADYTQVKKINKMPHINAIKMFI